MYIYGPFTSIILKLSHTYPSTTTIYIYIYIGDIKCGEKEKKRKRIITKKKLS